VVRSLVPNDPTTQAGRRIEDVMKSVWTLTATVSLLVATAAPTGGQPPMEDPTKDADYQPEKIYPLPAGATWTYEVAGGTLVTVKVAKQKEEKYGEEMVKQTWLETSINNMPISSEVVAVLKQGVCRLKVADKQIDPRSPLCFLELPPKKGKDWKKWKVDAKIGDETIKGEFTASEEEIDAKMIPYFANKEAKKVKLLVVKGTNLKAGDQPLSLTYYFAPDVGLVKQVATVSGVQVDLRLKSFEIPKTQ